MLRDLEDLEKEIEQLESDLKNDKVKDADRAFDQLDDKKVKALELNDQIIAHVEQVKKEMPDFPLERFTTGRLLDRAMEREHLEEAPRGHLGMSQIGNPDERTLWLAHRWCLPQEIEARILRIFHLGHVLEDMIIDYLRKVLVKDAKYIGLNSDPNLDPEQRFFEIKQIDPRTGKQYNFADDLGGHFSGSLDLQIRGIPEAPKAWHVADVKTCKAEKFADVVKDGTKNFSPEYYAQAQCYMAKTGHDRAVYIYYNKDTSELHFDRIKKEPFFFESMKEKAERILLSKAPPESSFSSRNYYQIKLWKSEEYQALYWGDKLPENVHCRNCRHASPIIEGTGKRWQCARHNVELNHIEQQLKGCDFHQFIPELMPIQFVADHGLDCAEYRTKGGTKLYLVAKVIKPQMKEVIEAFTSDEMIQLSAVEFNDDFLNNDLFIDIRKKMGGKLIEVNQIEGAE